MKRLVKMVMMACVVLFIVGIVQETVAQTRNTFKTEVNVKEDPALRVVKMTGTISGTDSVYSEPIYLNKVDSLYTVWAVFTSATDSARYGIKLYGGAGGNLTEVANISADSAESLLNKRNYFKETAEYYKLLVFGRTGNGYTTSYSVYMVMRKR
jgi:hypothetical protein